MICEFTRKSLFRFIKPLKFGKFAEEKMGRKAKGESKIRRKRHDLLEI